MFQNLVKCLFTISLENKSWIMIHRYGNGKKIRTEYKNSVLPFTNKTIRVVKRKTNSIIMEEKYKDFKNFIYFYLLILLSQQSLNLKK